MKCNSNTYFQHVIFFLEIVLALEYCFNLLKLFLLNNIAFISNKNLIKLFI